MIFFVGSHTGKIEAKGGQGDVTTGGSGAGGRIAVYHDSHINSIPYRGEYNTEGGSCHANAESGASGTAFIKHISDDYTTLRVDNKGQIPKLEKDTNQPLLGHRMDLSCGHRGKSNVYDCDGVQVTSSASTWNIGYRHPEYIQNDGSSYSLGWLFDQTLHNDINEVRYNTTVTK